MYSDGAVVIDIRANQTDFDNKVKNLAKTATAALAAVGATVAGMGAAVLAVGVDFESAFAGVRKTVNATDQELEQFRQGILEMSKTIPLAATEIAGIAEAAGQLGIQNENLLAFTRTMADLGVATNMTSDEAATSLARFANIVGMSQDNFDRLGSTIVDLGNNLATTESEIVAMSLRLAGAGAQIGLSESQIMGMAGALSSVGIEAEAGGTAFSTLMAKMQLAVETGTGQLESFANVAGMTTADFKKAFKDDAAGAITAFITGLGKVSETGDSAIKVLTDMDITEIRMRDALLRASGASEVFTKSMDIANAAWEENTSLTNEAAQRYETTESKMQLLKNTLTETGITAFEKFKVPFKDALDTGLDSVSQLNDELGSGKLGQSVDTLADGFADMTSTVIKLGTQALPIAVDSLAWIINNAGKIAVAGGTIAGALAGRNLIPAAIANIQKLQQAWKLASNSITAHEKANRLSLLATYGGLKKNEMIVGVLTGKVKLATIASAAWKAVMTPAGIGLIVGGIAALTAGYVLLNKKQNESLEAAKAYTKAISEQQTAFDDMSKASREAFVESSAQVELAERYNKELLSQVDANGKVTGSQERVNFLIDQLNQLLPNAGIHFDEMGEKVLDANNEVITFTDSINNLIEAQRAQAYLDAYQDDYAEAIQNKNELMKKQAELYQEINEKQAIYNEYSKLAHDALTEYDYGSEEYNNVLNKFLDDNGINSMLEFKQELDELTKSYETGAETLKGYTDLTSNFESMQEAISNSDWDKAKEIMSGLGSIETFDPDKGKEQVTNLENQVTNLEKLRDTIQEMKDKGEPIDESFLESLAEQIQTAQEELDEAKQTYMEQTAVDYSEYGTISGENWLAGIMPGFETAGSQQIDQARADATQASNEIVAIAAGTRPPAVIIPVLYQLMNSIASVTGGGGASYDDSQTGRSVLSAFSGGLISMSDRARSAMVGLSSAVQSRSVKLDQIKRPTAAGVNQKVEVSQVTNFNLPVERPSKTADKIAEINRELGKLLKGG
ncbi:phage tail tape measure protein [Holdemania massiliensis]|uniref:phage tail tape measure protein n=1 Tax=Holdemania massiliensis TaxID=1468449 RepID=UPI003568388F